MRYLRALFISSLLTLAIGCAPTNGGGEKHTTPPDEKTVQLAETTAAVNIEVETSEVIEASSFGLNGDGLTDNTALLQELLGSGNRTVHIEPGDYVIGSISIPSNTILKLDPGVVLRDSGQLGSKQRLINIQGENVRIEGLGAKVVANRTDYTSGEQRHGVFIYGARNVLIDGLESSSHGGDGFYIGGPAKNPSINVVLRGCSADNNRRQGLSITSARRVRVVDCEFANTRGTAPEFGVDLEPNDPIDFLDDIVIVRPRTLSNEGGGIMIYLNGLSASSYPVTVAIIDHDSDRESPPLRTSVPTGVIADLKYNRN